jgi:hypothetical protein
MFSPFPRSNRWYNLRGVVRLHRELEIDMKDPVDLTLELHCLTCHKLLATTSIEDRSEENVSVQEMRGRFQCHVDLKHEDENGVRGRIRNKGYVNGIEMLS